MKTKKSLPKIKATILIRQELLQFRSLILFLVFDALLLSILELRFGFSLITNISYKKLLLIN